MRPAMEPGEVASLFPVVFTTAVLSTPLVVVVHAVLGWPERTEVRTSVEVQGAVADVALYVSILVVEIISVVGNGVIVLRGMDTGEGLDAEAVSDDEYGSADSE